MSLQERLKLTLSQEGKKLTKAGMARACAVSPPSVSDWFSGRTATIEGENLVRAAGYLGVNPHWLATGEGRMKGEDRSQSNEQFAALPDRLKAVTLTVAGMFKVIPEDRWGASLVDIAELLQKDHRFQ